METQPKTTGQSAFKIWGADDVIYGPVELTTLLEWAKDERVTASTWVFDHTKDSWRKAAQVRELRRVLYPGSAEPESTTETTYSVVNLKPGTLRRVKILADFTDTQLMEFVQFMEVMSVKQFTQIVQQGQLGQAMYLVLEGELRVRLMISGKESILATLGAGEFFGEMSLFDEAPRSTDVVANVDSLLIKIELEHFNHLVHVAPELGAKFLYAIGKTLAARIRADNKRYKDSVNFARTSGSERH